MKPKYILAAAALMASTTALADVQAGNTYMGGQFSWTTVDISGVSSDFEPSAAVFRFGHFLVDNFAIEARAGTGISDDTHHYSGIDVTGEIDHVLGLYGTGYLPLGDSPVSLYGLVGFTRGKATLSSDALGISESDSDTDFSYGVGVQGQVAPQLSANLEYMSYLDKSDYEVSAIGVGLNYHF
ncbi:porin family protein [Billgrantia saliphila]|uniref:porin family protein n=1 Tax=Billgrantia saliphila TaxID=1848458 RepID=UPI0018CC69DF|nr:porin family protein [Halomonas saliphila]